MPLELEWYEPLELEWYEPLELEWYEGLMDAFFSSMFLLLLGPSEPLPKRGFEEDSE